MCPCFPVQVSGYFPNLAIIESMLCNKSGMNPVVITNIDFSERNLPSWVSSKPLNARALQYEKAIGAWCEIWESMTYVEPFPKRQILDSSKLKESADDNFEFDEYGRKFSKWIQNSVGKGEIARYEQFLLFPQCFQKTCTADT